MNQPETRFLGRLSARARIAAPLAAAAVSIAAMLVASHVLGQGRIDHMPRADETLPGRATPTHVPGRHVVFGAPLDSTFPGMERAFFGMGCFWGAEAFFFRTPGVVSTAVGFAGGTTPNPSYEEVCTGRTGHAEVVRVIYDPHRISYEQLLRVFWENHDPTEGMRQGNDVGTQYRSVIYTVGVAQRTAALASRDAYNVALGAAGHGPITTEIRDAPTFYFAEDYHQQYCAVNPHGYCQHEGTGVSFVMPHAASVAAH